MNMVGGFLWLESWNGGCQHFRKDSKGVTLYMSVTSWSARSSAWEQMRSTPRAYGSGQETKATWPGRSSRWGRPCLCRHTGTASIHNLWFSQRTSQQDHGTDPPRNYPKTLGKHRGDWGQLANCACQMQWLKEGQLMLLTWTCARHLTLAHMTSLSLNWRCTLMLWEEASAALIHPHCTKTTSSVWPVGRGSARPQAGTAGSADLLHTTRENKCTPPLC